MFIHILAHAYTLTYTRAHKQILVYQYYEFLFTSKDSYVCMYANASVYSTIVISLKASLLEPPIEFKI